MLMEPNPYMDYRSYHTRNDHMRKRPLHVEQQPHHHSYNTRRNNNPQPLAYYNTTPEIIYSPATATATAQTITSSNNDPFGGPPPNQPDLLGYTEDDYQPIPIDWENDPLESDDPLSLNFQEPAQPQKHTIESVTTRPNNQLGPSDVICGRGAGSNNHPGNVRFRELIGANQDVYLAAKPFEKAQIAKRIVADVTSSGGRFMKRVSVGAKQSRNNDGGEVSWTELSDRAAREKTCQALRERDEKGQAKVVATTIISRPVASLKKNSTTSINDNDVLFGRGGVTNSHLGNKTYRELVRERQPEYVSAAKLEKAKVAMKVVLKVKARGGRFMTEKDGEWVEVSQEKAREKTSQALREGAALVRKKLKKRSKKTVRNL